MFCPEHLPSYNSQSVSKHHLESMSGGQWQAESPLVDSVGHRRMSWGMPGTAHPRSVPSSPLAWQHLAHSRDKVAAMCDPLKPHPHCHMDGDRDYGCSPYIEGIFTRTPTECLNQWAVPGSEDARYILPPRYVSL